MRPNRISLVAMAMSGGMLLAACGGSDNSTAQQPVVVSTNTNASIDKSTGAQVVAAVISKPFTFDAGVPDFGISSATSVTLSGAPAMPSFTISSAEGSATGVVTFGSCIFTVSDDSTFPDGHPLGKGKKVIVDPCEIDIATAGVVAGSVTSASAVSFNLKNTKSRPQSLSIFVDPATGAITLNGANIGKTATLIRPTGA